MTSKTTINVKSLVGRHQQQPSSTTAIESKLADILDQALNTTSTPTAESVASSIDELYASEYASDDKAESYFSTLWSFYIEAAKRVPADDDARHQLIVSAVDKLKGRDRGTAKVWRKDTAVWGDLPMLGPCMREAWNFSPKFDNSSEDNAAIESWLNLNSFAARLLGASITSWDNFAIWALREGLEDEPKNEVARDAHLAVAHEWITHAGRVLNEKGRKPGDLDDAGKRVLRPGKLFQGESGLNAERWHFWGARLETLGKEAGGEGVKSKALKAAETVKSLKE